MATKKPTSTPQPKGWLNSHRQRLVKGVRRGRGVSLDFFRRNGWLIMFFTVIVLILIGMRYRTRMYMKEINDLNRDLRTAENEFVASKSEYMSLIRETDMVELTRRHNLGLQFPLTPPFTLTLEQADSVAKP